MDAIPDGAPTPGSGCSTRPTRKGDAVGSLWRGEGKTREKVGAKSITLTRAWHDKIRAEAFATGHRPLLVYGWPADPREDRDEEDWAAFPLEDAKLLMHTVNALLAGDVDAAVRYAEAVKA